MARSVCFSCNADSGVGPLLDGWTSVPIGRTTLFACPKKGCKRWLTRYLGIAGPDRGVKLGRTDEDRAEDERWWAGHYERQMRGTVD